MADDEVETLSGPRALRGVAQLDIALDMTGRGRIVINGVDHADHVGAVHYSAQCRGQQIPRLVVEMLTGDHTIEGPGIVETVRDAGESDLRAFLLQWLEEQDPDDVEREALADAGMNVTSGQAILDALRKRAAR